MPESSKCGDAADGHSLRVRQHRFRVLAGALPVALAESRARPQSEHVRPRVIDVVLLAIRQTVAQVSGRIGVEMLLYRIGGEVHVCARHVFVKTARAGELQTAFEVGPARGIAHEQTRRTEIV